MDAVNNTVMKLRRREISSKRYQGFNNAEEHFSHFQLQEEYDTYDHEEDVLPISFQNNRSMIEKIFVTGDVIFARAQPGVWTAFSRDIMKKIWSLNVGPDETFYSLFYNKRNDSLITVSVSDPEGFYICRTTTIESIKMGEADGDFRIFQSERLKSPGFVEFDDVNGKVLTYSLEDRIYKVFDLENYELLYSISRNNIEEIQRSPGILLLIHERTPLGVPLKIVSIEDGTVLKSFNYLLDSNKHVDFIKLFHEKLFVKPEFENLQIVDVRDPEVKAEISKSADLSESIILYEYSLILNLTKQTVKLWDFKGELVTSFEDKYSNNIHITSNRDLVIYFCRNNSTAEESNRAVGYINISNILSRKCVGKITDRNSRKCIKASNIRSTVAEALEDITAIFYDKERNEIYTGTRLGLVHVWSN